MVSSSKHLYINSELYAMVLLFFAQMFVFKMPCSTAIIETDTAAFFFRSPHKVKIACNSM